MLRWVHFIHEVAALGNRLAWALIFVYPVASIVPSPAPTLWVEKEEGDSIEKQDWRRTD